jgi:hypothetical protein
MKTVVVTAAVYAAPVLWPLVTLTQVGWHAGYSCPQFQALPEELRATKDDLALVQLAQQQHWARCPQCRCAGGVHMQCNCMRVVEWQTVA